MNTNPQAAEEYAREHAWVHEHLAAALLAGLTPEEQSRFDAHIHTCPPCFDAYTEARDADRTLQRALDTLTPAPHFEDRLLTTLRENTHMQLEHRPRAKRLGFAIAAAVALAATGVFAQYITPDDNVVITPITHMLADRSSPPSFYEYAAGSYKVLGGKIPRLIQSVSGGDFENQWAGTPRQGDPGYVAPVYNDDNTESAKTAASPSPPVAAAPSASAMSQGIVGKDQAPSPTMATRSLNKQQAGLAIAKSGSNDKGRYEELDRATRQQAAGESSSLKARSEIYDPEVASPPEPKSVALKDLSAKYPDVLTENSPVPTGNAVSTTATTQPGTSADAAPADARKIIRSGTLEFEVHSFDDASTTITKIATEESGFVSSTSSDKLANGAVRGTLIVRVPPDHLDRFLLKLRALGDLKNQQIGATDITKEYTDLDSELRALHAMESRLLDIIKNANGQVKDLLVAEKQLGEYRIRIEKIEGELRYDNNLISMATLTITAYEKDIKTPTAAQEQEDVTLALQAEDVETRYADARKTIDDAKGRIIEGQLQHHDADQFTAQITAEVPPEKAELVIARLKQLGTVANFTRERRQTTTGGSGSPNVEVEEKPTHLNISLYNLVALAPRETRNMALTASDVPASYNKLLTQLQSLESVGNAKILSSQLNQSDPNRIDASVTFDIKRDALPTIDKTFADAGIDILSRNVTRSNDTNNTTDSKVRFQIDNLTAVDALAPQRTTTLGYELPDVEKSLDTLRQQLEKENAAHIQYTINREPSGRAVGHLVFDLPTQNTAAAFAHISDLRGEEKTRQVIDDPNAPHTRFARERIDVTLASSPAILAEDNGILHVLRIALASAAAALLWSLYLIMTGILFLAPWIAIIWLIRRMLKRRATK